MQKEEKRRQVRSDKKRDVKPTVPIELYECIHRISYLTAQPIKTVGEELCKKGLKSQQVIEHLSNHFRRDFWATPSLLYRGDSYIEKVKLQGKIKRRITIRFMQCDHDRLAALAYAMDQTVSSATTLLLHATVKNVQIVDQFITRHIEHQLDSNKRKELRKILKFININNPYEEEISLGMLLNYLINEVVHGAESVRTAIDKWVERNNTNTH